MSLEKGFLRGPEFRLTGWHIFSALVISSFVALLFHGLFVFVREALRIGISQPSRVHWLGASELQIYDTALAALSGAIGQGFAIVALFQYVSHRSPFKTRLSQGILRGQTNITLWAWLFFTGEFLIAFAIIYAVFELHYDLDMKEDFWMLIWGAPLVWFLNNWLHGYRLLRKQHFKWLGMSFLHWIALTFILAEVPWTDYDSIERNIRNWHPELRYEMEFAEGQSLLTKTWRTKTSLYLIRQDTSTRILLEGSDWRWRDKAVGFDELTQLLTHAYFPERDFYRRTTLTIDARVPLKDVLRLERVLKRFEVDKIYYTLAIKNSKYPWQYVKSQRLGMPKRLPWPCEHAKSNLDSLKQLGYKARQIRWPELPCYIVPQVMEDNRVLISQTQEGITLNNLVINPHLLLDKLTQLRKKYEQDLVVLYRPAPDLNFGDYIEGRDLIFQSTILNRIQYSHDEHGFEYEYCEHNSCDYANRGYYDWLHRKYPNYLVELTNWNLELYNYLKDQP